MGKGSNTTSSNTQTAANPQAAAAYSNLLTEAQKVASTPYQAYTGELTAPVNSQQQAGIAGINANANSAAPSIAQATGLAAGAANPLTQQQIQSYLSPYTQNVVDTTNAQLQHSAAQQSAQLQGNQIAQGALGGNATGVAKGIAAANTNLGIANTDAQLYSSGYQGAVNTAYQQYQQNPLAAGNAIANYGISGQNAALTGAGQQINAGTLQQQTQQAQDTANYGQYAQAQAYPYQQTQWLAGIDTGVGSNLGGTSYGTTTAPAPNQTAQYLGAGVAAAGLFLNRGGAVRRAFGGGVAGYADGGAPGAMPWGGIASSWIPQMSIHGGSGAPAAHAPSAANTAQPAVDFTKLSSGITGLGKKLGSSGSGTGDGSWVGDSSVGGAPLSGYAATPTFTGDLGGIYARGGGVSGYADGGAPVDWQDAQAMFGEGEPELRSGASFEERGAPVREAIAHGDFDPRGANSTEFRGSPAMEASNRGLVPTPGARPSAAPVEAADDDEDETPAAKPVGVAGRSTGAPSPGVTAFAPTGPSSYQDIPDAITQPSKKDGFGLGLISPNAKSGLLAAGLGMLASRSPNLGNAIGDGGIAGVSAYGAAQQHDDQIASEAAKLSREARQKFIDNTLKIQSQAETARHNKATEDKEFKPQLIHHPDPVTGQEVYGSYDPNTKQIKPLDFPTPGDVSKTSGKYVSDAPPAEERRKAPAASPEARDEGYLKWLGDHRPPGYADIVRGVTDYEMDPNRIESLQKGQRSQLYRDAKLYDPTYDQTHFKEKGDVIASFSKGTDRAAVNSLNVSVSHLGTLSKLGDALQNGNFPIVNRLLNQANIQTGGQTVTNFNAAKEIVGDEVVKAIVGGVSAQADRDAIKHLIMAQQSPAQLKGTIDTFISLLGGQLEGRRIGYQAGTGLNNFDQKYLSPETREALAGQSGNKIDPNTRQMVTRAVYPSGVPKEGQAPGAPGGGSAPPAAVDMLRKNPSLAPMFDQKYGPGSSQQYLGR